MKKFNNFLAELNDIIKTYNQKDIKLDIVKNSKGKFELVVDDEVIDTFENEAKAKKEAEAFLKVTEKQ